MNLPPPPPPPPRAIPPLPPPSGKKPEPEATAITWTATEDTGLNAAAIMVSSLVLAGLSWVGVYTFSRVTTPSLDSGSELFDSSWDKGVHLGSAWGANSVGFMFIVVGGWLAISSGKWIKGKCPYCGFEITTTTKDNGVDRGGVECPACKRQALLRGECFHRSDV